jgi:hypothetical protein
VEACDGEYRLTLLSGNQETYPVIVTLELAVARSGETRRTAGMRTSCRSATTPTIHVVELVALRPAAPFMWWNWSRCDQ